MPLNRPLKLHGRRKVLTKNMILDAQSSCKSASECARWLGVTFNTYKKWATYYKIYETGLYPNVIGYVMNTVIKIFISQLAF